MTVKIRFGISQPHLLTVFIFFQFTDDNASVPQFYAGGMKRFCHFPDMVRPHMIHDHDVSLLQARNEESPSGMPKSIVPLCRLHM